MTEKRYLRGVRGYLSGPIENDVDYDWRTEPKKILLEKFGINLFDPFSDPKQQWVSAINDAKKEKDYDRIAAIAKKFVRKDLCVVDRSDIVIAYLPHKVSTTGTVHEIINSVNAKKPTLLVTNMGDITYIPVWYYGFIPTSCMFPDWNSLYEYLDRVDQGMLKDNNRWAYIYEEI